jgi:hypothetical protein
MKKRFLTSTVLNPDSYVFHKAIVDDEITIETSDTAGICYNFHVSAINNSPVGSNIVELTGRIAYLGFSEVRAMIWVRYDGRITFGVDTNNLARREREESRKKESLLAPVDRW